MIPYSLAMITENENRGWWGKKSLIDYLEENAGITCNLVHPCDCNKQIDPKRIAYKAVHK